MVSQDSFWLRIIYMISFILSGAVAFLILGPRPMGVEGALDVSALPSFNALMNGITTILLVYGFILIKQKKRKRHKIVMLSAFGTSATFLTSYVVYHWFKSGPKLYGGDWTLFYYFILISHIVLAAFIIPLAFVTLYRGWNNQLGKHRTIAKITLPIWFYVSLTGVMIYGMLYL